MSQHISVSFDDLATSDLVVDALYEGGRRGNRGDDPIAKLLPVGNAGGFRFVGSPTAGTVRALALYTSNADADWPDRLDAATGTFSYYGDNKAPGRQLHDTPRKGNLFLSLAFALVSEGVLGRRQVPPILLFAKGGRGADVHFRGLLVPSSPLVPVDEQLVAIWRSAGDQRFQNYRATFSVLDVPCVSREWITAVVSGEDPVRLAPPAWEKWVRTGVIERLQAPKALAFRTREDQIPKPGDDSEIVAAIHEHFAGRPHDFEQFAAQIWMMIAPATDEIEVTRPSRDGGRDAVGRYAIGPPGDLVRIDFALEAKCYGPLNSVGVREMSRLISRLRHRQFGVLVTTSYVNRQAYQEVRDDGHPIAIVSGRDIVEVLKRRGWGSLRAVRQWLVTEFPRAQVGQVEVVTPGVIVEVDESVVRSN
ncbi:restriction endonuclease [Nocardioides iriomotensis]|uniref:Restriction endonuclease n=1 Tax=Nocardioides iriomotensis TaxID=715784 RepID=A0A4Q5IUU6_9ACTN|nr:restriction endonuclease [Nocardioides iriomotensis]RYU09674.1 restriction endonuclease [Nocardioides iriomotensis]